MQRLSLLMQNSRRCHNHLRWNYVLKTKINKSIPTQETNRSSSSTANNTYSFLGNKKVAICRSKRIHSRSSTANDTYLFLVNKKVAIYRSKKDQPSSSMARHLPIPFKNITFKKLSICWNKFSSLNFLLPWKNSCHDPAPTLAGPLEVWSSFLRCL